MRTMLVVAAAAWLHVRVRNRRPASATTMDKVTQALLLLLFACSAATIVARTDEMSKRIARQTQNLTHRSVFVGSVSPESSQRPKPLYESKTGPSGDLAVSFQAAAPWMSHEPPAFTGTVGRS